jgi:hypothetical protein
MGFSFMGNDKHMSLLPWLVLDLYFRTREFAPKIAFNGVQFFLVNHG